MTTIPGMQPFDATDAAILRELREIQARIDPCPAGLVERITFALTVQALHAEVAELTSTAGLLTRAAVEDAEEAVTVTFSAESMSIMLTVSDAGPGRARIDGWLTGGGAEVELTGPDGATTRTLADPDGRFVLDAVPRGAARLLVRRGQERPVLTPTFVL